MGAVGAENQIGRAGGGDTSFVSVLFCFNVYIYIYVSIYVERECLYLDLVFYDHIFIYSIFVANAKICALM